MLQGFLIKCSAALILMAAPWRRSVWELDNRQGGVCLVWAKAAGSNWSA